MENLNPVQTWKISLGFEGCSYHKAITLNLCRPDLDMYVRELTTPGIKVKIELISNHNH